MLSESAQALREVTSSHTNGQSEPNSRVMIEGGENTESKVSIATVMSQWMILCL